MDNACGFSLVEPPLSPRSPPAALDLYGKRRQLVKLQSLEREITLLQEELKTFEDLQPASRCCKELDDFIGAKADPFVAIKQESHKFSPFWKRLWGCFCCNLPCVCCSSSCLHHPQNRHCFTCYLYSTSSVPAASAPERSLVMIVGNARAFHACPVLAAVSSLLPSLVQR